MGAETGPGGDEKGLAEGQKYFTVGLRFGGGVVAYTLGGYALDRWLHSIPVFTLVGTLGGAVLSFISVYRQLVLEPRAARKSKSEKQ